MKVMIVLARFESSKEYTDLQQRWEVLSHYVVCDILYSLHGIIYPV